MKKKLVNKVLCYGLAAAMAFGSMPVSAAEIGTTEISVDTEAVADDSEDISEDAEDESAAETSVSGDSLVVDAEEDNDDKDWDIFSLDWKNATNELIDNYLSYCSDESISRWVQNLTDADIDELMMRDTNMNKPLAYYGSRCDDCGLVWGAEFDSALDYYKTLASCKNVRKTFASAEGSFIIRFTGYNPCDTTIKASFPNYKTSELSKKQQVDYTIMNATHDLKISKQYNHKTAANSKDGDFYICLMDLQFSKPAGYAIDFPTYTSNYTSKKGKLFNGIVFNESTNVYSVDANNMYAGSRDYEHTTTEKATLEIDAIYNMNVGTSTSGNVNNREIITFNFTPAKYYVAYDSNGGSTVANQECTYGTSYKYSGAPTTAAYFTLSVGLNGGTGAASEIKVPRAFLNWGNVNAGADFSNLTTTNGATITKTANWGDGTCTLPQTPSKTGYQFAGWQTSQGTKGAGTTYTANQSETIDALWTANKYTVNFVCDGKTVGSQSFTYGTAQNLKTLASLGISKPGYTFAGWNHQYKDGDSVNNLTDVNGGSVTLTTQWTANTDTPYTINRYVQKEFDNTDPATGYEIYKAPEGTENPLLGTEIKAATTDTSVTEIPTAIPGYETPDAITQNISGDGSTTFNFYYNLIDNRATVTVNHYYQTVEGGDYVLYDGKFGDYAQNNYTNTFSGTVGENKEIPFLTSDTDAMTNFGYAYKDYILVPVDAAPKTVTLTKETVVNYYYNLKRKNTAVEYKVEHYIQRSEGGQYELYKTVKDWADLGSTITPALNEDAISEVNKIEGCKCDKPQLQVVTVKEGLVVKYYYACISKAAAGKDGENGKDGQNAVDITDEATINEIAKKLAAGLSFKLDLEGASYEIVQNPDGSLGIKFVTTTDTKVVIPDVIKIGDKVYRITEVHDKAFYDNTSLREVVVSKNISTIGNSAFEKCINLKTVKLNEGLVNIGDKAFRDCSALESVKMPSTVQNIGNYAFENCVKLKTVRLNNGLLKIGKKAFYNCKSLKKIKIPKSVLKIGSYAFGKCIKLASVTFAAESQLLEMGEGCFYYCRALKKISLPAKLTTVPVKCFKSDTKLTSVTIGKNVTKIRKQAFSGCKKIKKITLPSRVQTIESQAFYNCKSLKNVTIKSNALTGVGSKAFKKCKKGIQFKIPNKKTASYKKLFKGKY